MFQMACYQHYTITRDLNFLKKVLPQIQNIENFFLNNVAEYGFVPADYSIWEESSDPHTGKFIKIEDLPLQGNLYPLPTLLLLKYL